MMVCLLNVGLSKDSCKDCLDFIGIKADTKECKAELVMDYKAGKCGEIAIISEVWDFGDNQGGSGFWTTHEYDGNGTYVVTATITYQVVATGEICTSTSTDIVTITDCNKCDNCLNLIGLVVLDQKDCKAEFVLDYNVQCPGVQILSHDWDFGDGTSMNGGYYESHAYNSNGTYTVSGVITYTYNGETCTAAAVTEVTIEGCEDPCEECINLFGIETLSINECKAEFVLDYNFQCEGMTLKGHKWDFGDGTTTSGGFWISHTYTSNGTYTVTGTVVYTLADGTECYATATTTVEITDCGDSCEDCINLFGIETLSVNECNAEFVLDYNFQCEGMTLVGHKWDFGDGTTTSGGFWINHTYVANGLYTVTGTVVFTLADGTECYVSASTKVKITDCEETCEDCINLFGLEVLSIDECKAEFVIDYNFQCEGMTLLAHNWDFGDGTTVAGGFWLSHMYAANGTYTVTGSVVFRLADGTVCEEFVKTEVTITDCGESCEDCINLFGVEVFSVDECTAEFVLDYNFQCQGMTVISHTWDFGDGSTAAGGFYISHTYNANGIYTVTGTITYQLADGTICTADAKTEVKITDCKNCDNCLNLLGLVVYSIDECEVEFVLDYNVQCPGVTILSHDYDFGDSNSASGGFNVVHTYGSNGTYTATGTITFSYNGEICKVSASTIVEVTDCNDCETTAPENPRCQYFGNQLQLVWDPVPGATCYVISIEPDNNDPNTKKCCKIPNAFQPFAVSVLSNKLNVSPNWPKCFKWRVRACCGVGNFGPWSAYRCQNKFSKCPIVGIANGGNNNSDSINDKLQDGELSVYPNPGSNEFNIQFTAEPNTIADISIVDNTGKLVYSLSQQSGDLGNIYLQWTPSYELLTGIYFLEVRTENKIYHEKLLLQR